MARRVRPLPPIHQPEAVAAAILRAAETAPRELWVGFAAIRAILGNMLAPVTLDRLLAGQAYQGQLTAEARRSAGFRDNLFEPSPTGHATHGRFDAEASNSALIANPAVLRAAGLALSAAVLLCALIAAGRRRGSNQTLPGGSRPVPRPRIGATCRD
jgi:hypothetical protein